MKNKKNIEFFKCPRCRKHLFLKSVVTISNNQITGCIDCFDVTKKNLFRSLEDYLENNY